MSVQDLIISERRNALRNKCKIFRMKIQSGKISNRQKHTNIKLSSSDIKSFFTYTSTKIPNTKGKLLVMLFKIQARKYKNRAYLHTKTLQWNARNKTAYKSNKNINDDYKLINNKSCAIPVARNKNFPLMPNTRNNFKELRSKINSNKLMSQIIIGKHEDYYKDQVPSEKDTALLTCQKVILKNHSAIQKLKESIIKFPCDALPLLTNVTFQLFIVFKGLFTKPNHE